MNKKIALFLLALGIGMAGSPVIASGAYYCAVDYRQCIANGYSVEECAAEQRQCVEDWCSTNFCHECSGGCPP